MIKSGLQLNPKSQSQFSLFLGRPRPGPSNWRALVLQIGSALVLQTGPPLDPSKWRVLVLKFGPRGTSERPQTGTEKDPRVTNTKDSKDPRDPQDPQRPQSPLKTPETPKTAETLKTPTTPETPRENWCAPWSFKLARLGADKSARPGPSNVHLQSANRKQKVDTGPPWTPLDPSEPFLDPSGPFLDPSGPLWTLLDPSRTLGTSVDRFSAWLKVVFKERIRLQPVLAHKCRKA